MKIWTKINFLAKKKFSRGWACALHGNAAVTGSKLKVLVASDVLGFEKWPYNGALSKDL